MHEHLLWASRCQVPNPCGPIAAAGDERLAVGEACESHYITHMGFGSG